jgi:hypothetical protein
MRKQQTAKQQTARQQDCNTALLADCKQAAAGQHQYCSSARLVPNASEISSACYLQTKQQGTSEISTRRAKGKLLCWKQLQ